MTAPLCGDITSLLYDANEDALRAIAFFGLAILPSRHVSLLVLAQHLADEGPLSTT